MKPIQTLTTLTLGASLMLTPFLAFAREGGAESSGALRVGLFGDHDDADVRGEASLRVDAKGDRPVRSSDWRVAQDQKDDTNGRVGARGEASIDMRISALERLADRLDGATRLSGDAKARLSARIEAQIKALTELKAKAGTDASVSSMRDGMGKVRSEFRGYGLVLPQAALTAAIDRTLTIAAQMDVFGTKLDARIDAAADAGMDVDTARDAYDDYVANVASAKAQARAAAEIVADLKSDDDDKAAFEANAAALAEARAKLKAAALDLKEARADIGVILKTVKGASAEAKAR